MAGSSPRRLKFRWPLALWCVLVRLTDGFVVYLNLTDDLQEMERSGDTTVVDIITYISCIVGKASLSIGNVLLLMKSSEMARCLNSLLDLDLGERRLVAADRGTLLPLLLQLLANVAAVVYASDPCDNTLACLREHIPGLLFILGFSCLVMPFVFVTLALSKDLERSVDEALTPAPSGGPRPRAEGAHLVVARFLHLEKQVWKVRGSLPARYFDTCNRIMHVNK